MTTALDIVTEARTWLGTPFHHQGRVKGVGVDCAGLVICTAKELGLVAQDYDFKGYSRTPDGGSLIAECDRLLTRIGQEDMRPGCVAVFHFAHDPQHLGIVADYLHGGLSLIHALASADGKGSVVEQRLSIDILRRLVQGYAFPGVA